MIKIFLISKKNSLFRMNERTNNPDYIDSEAKEEDEENEEGKYIFKLYTLFNVLMISRIKFRLANYFSILIYLIIN